jgi:23S rRNA pseudouridine2605 synthase
MPTNKPTKNVVGSKKTSKPDKQKGMIRLNKYIAASGVCSRRKADQMITDGFVKLNGKTVRELGTQVNAKTDEVMVKNRRLQPQKTLKAYFAINKPPQMMVTMSDPEGRPTVADLVKHLKIRLFPVGRLDWDSEGLLIMTNDGDFANEVMHPKHGVTKTYLAKLNGQPSENDLRKLVSGVTIPGGKASALKAERVRSRNASDKYDWVRVVIEEGRNRQVRKMFEKIGYDVMKLQRVSIGQLALGTMLKGAIKELTPQDLKKVFERDIIKITPRPRREDSINPKERNSKPKKRFHKGVDSWAEEGEDADMPTDEFD